MIRAAALLLLMMTLGAQAKECGVSSTAALAPFKGTWVAEGANDLIFGAGSLGYRRVDMTKSASLHVVAPGQLEENDDVSLDCEILDKAGIARLVATLQDYAALMKNGPTYVREVMDIASVQTMLDHPPYPMITATYYEGISYYVLLGKGRLIAIETGEAQLDLVTYKDKNSLKTH